MATLRKRGTKWQAQVRRKGYPPLSRSFDAKTDAQKWARQMETGLELGTLALPTNEEPTESKEIPTLEALVCRYLGEATPKKKGSGPETYRLKSFLSFFPLVSRPIDTLGTKDFAAHRDRRLRDGLAPSSVKRELNIIRRVFEVARDEWGISIRENPLSKLSIRAPDDSRERRLAQGRNGEPGELERLLAATIHIRTPHLREIIVFAVETGLRRGEILSLRWKDLDLQRRILRVAEAKNGYPRRVPLSKPCMALLESLRDSGGLLDINGAIFGGVSANALRLAWERLREKAGIEDLRFHDLRHEAISRLFEKGLSVPEVASISGHRDYRMLQRYSHARHETILDKLDATDI